MVKFVFVVSCVVLFIAESSCWRSDLPIILPTYQPPVTQRTIIIRTVRDAGDEPLWLYKEDDIPRAPATGDHPVLPAFIDDVKLDPNRRYVRSVAEPLSPEILQRVARSFDSRSGKRQSGGHFTSGGSRDTDATHPGYNRRNA